MQASSVHPSLSLAVLAQRQRDWPEMMQWLHVATTCGDDVSEATGWNMLSAVYGGNPDFAGAVEVDQLAAAACAARSCELLLRANGGGAPPGEQREVYFIMVKDCTQAVMCDTVSPDDAAVWAAVVGALRAAVAACEKSPDETHAATAVTALAGLANVARNLDDLDRAARHIRRLLAVAQRAGDFDSAYVNDQVLCARVNLAILEAKTDDEHDRAVKQAEQLIAGGASEGFSGEYSKSEGPTAVERPACSACGAQPLTTKVCGGTCGGAARYCDAACYTAHIRQHMRESGCKKRK